MHQPSSPLWIVLGLTACGNVMMEFHAPDAPIAVGADGSTADGASVDPIADGATPECNGYEPCGIHPVVMPTGYTAINGVDYDEYGVYGSCTSFEDCGMWDTHFSETWLGGITHLPVDPYYDRMGSPFPWAGSRYWIGAIPTRGM